MEQATWLLGVGRLQLTDNVKRNQYYGLKANFDWVICTKDQDCKGLYGKKNCWSTRQCSAATFYIDP